MTEDKKDGNNELKKNIRLVQALMMGVFALGLSMIGGDLVGAWDLPISSFSITTTMFGAGGAAICEVMARRLA